MASGPIGYRGEEEAAEAAEGSGGWSRGVAKRTWRPLAGWRRGSKISRGLVRLVSFVSEIGRAHV